MPFKNAAQKRVCLYKWIEDIRRGKEPPKWDCNEFAKYVYNGRKYVIHRGPRGGYYIMINDKKKYLKLDYA